MKKIFILILLIILLFIMNYKKYIDFAFKIKDNYTDKSIIIDNKFQYDKYISYYEEFYISPYNPILLKMYHDLYKTFKSILIDQLQNYVTFTRLKIYNSDRINCDWCSMANGLIYLIKKSIEKYISEKNINKLKTILNIDISIINRINDYIGLGLLFRNFNTEDEIIKYKKYKKYKLNDNNIEKLYNDIIKLYVYLEKIELRYCPFKAYVNYYRNSDPRYLPINKESIYYAGEILSKYETIECQMCNKEINNKIDLKYIETDETVSPMKEFYEYVLNN